MKKWNAETLQIEALKYNTKKDFVTYSSGAYQTACRMDILKDICSHMKRNRNEWSFENIKKSALKFKKIVDWQKAHSAAYIAALKMKILDDVCSHMPVIQNKFNKTIVLNEAKKYKNLQDFKKNNRFAYNYAYRYNFLEEIKLFLISNHNRWTIDVIVKETKKYKCIKDLREAQPNLYGAILRNKLKKTLFLNMEPCSRPIKWTKEKIEKESQDCPNRFSFEKKNASAYQAARKKGLLHDLFSNKPSISGASVPELELMDAIKNVFPKTQKMISKNVTIENKPHIFSFHIDIYIPELRKGIEFDGRYWHSLGGLKRGRPHWPNEDLKNYHQIKDDYFKTKGVQVLHIKEENWIKAKEKCIQECWDFLNE